MGTQESVDIEKAYLKGQPTLRGFSATAEYYVTFITMQINYGSQYFTLKRRLTDRDDTASWKATDGTFRPFTIPAQEYLTQNTGRFDFNYDNHRYTVDRNMLSMEDYDTKENFELLIT